MVECSNREKLLMFEICLAFVMCCIHVISKGVYHLMIIILTLQYGGGTADGHSTSVSQSSQSDGHTTPVDQSSQSDGHTTPVNQSSQADGHTTPVGRSSQAGGEFEFKL